MYSNLTRQNYEVQFNVRAPFQSIRKQFRTLANFEPNFLADFL